MKTNTFSPPFGGYKKRKGIIAFDRRMELLGFENYDDLKEAQCKWVDSAI